MEESGGNPIITPVRIPIPLYTSSSNPGLQRAAVTGTPNCVWINQVDVSNINDMNEGEINAVLTLMNLRQGSKKRRLPEDQDELPPPQKKPFIQLQKPSLWGSSAYEAIPTVQFAPPPVLIAPYWPFQYQFPQTPLLEPQTTPQPQESTIVRLRVPPKRTRIKVSRMRLPADKKNEMMAWLLANVSHPYPDELQKQTWTIGGVITLQQVNNFLTNARRRMLPSISK